MPWRPVGDGRTDQRLNPYRDRAASLSRNGVPVATLILQMEQCWTQVGGRLWWRRWSTPYEIVHGYMQFEDGQFTDWVLDPDDWIDELDLWQGGQMPFMGELLDVEWLDENTASRLRADMFGSTDE